MRRKFVAASGQIVGLELVSAVFVVHALESHGAAVFSCIGAMLLLAGYAGMHWIARRRYYRKHRRGPPPSYFTAWLTRTAEGYLGVFFLLAAMVGFVCLFVALIDLIDG